MDFGVEGLPDAKENRPGARVFVFCEFPDTGTGDAARFDAAEEIFFAVFTAAFFGFAATGAFFAAFFGADFSCAFFTAGAGVAFAVSTGRGVAGTGVIRG